MFVDYTGLPERLVRGPMGYFRSKIKQVMKNIKSILDECMTLWGEPERVHVRAERGAVACVIRM